MHAIKCITILWGLCGLTCIAALQKYTIDLLVESASSLPATMASEMRVCWNRDSDKEALSLLSAGPSSTALTLLHHPLPVC